MEKGKASGKGALIKLKITPTARTVGKKGSLGADWEAEPIQCEVHENKLGQVKRALNSFRNL